MLVMPGQRVGRITDATSGPGTYIRGQHIHSSLVGRTVADVSKEGIRTIKVIVCSANVLRKYLSICRDGAGCVPQK